MFVYAYDYVHAFVFASVCALVCVFASADVWVLCVVCACMKHQVLVIVFCVNTQCCAHEEHFVLLYIINYI